MLRVWRLLVSFASSFLHSRTRILRLDRPYQEFSGIGGDGLWIRLLGLSSPLQGNLRGALGGTLEALRLEDSGEFCIKVVPCLFVVCFASPSPCCRRLGPSARSNPKDIITEAYLVSIPISLEHLRCCP